MEIILEFIYTGSIKENSLTENNLVKAYYATDYFQLSDLQDFIIQTLQNILAENYIENCSPELLSNAVEIMPLSEENNFLNLLVKEIATILLNDIEVGRLSITALQYLLYCSYEKEIPFATSEYEVFRYSSILAAKHAKQVSNDTYKILMEWLPTLEQIKQLDSLVRDSKSLVITGHNHFLPVQVQFSFSPRLTS
ncbi:hypothetical protein RclHR1_03400015 [Rhizophagus clarus]|uniref:BTB domain-containing protein n=1 Tax=Rhizophagus clarus TaxID=94130 RepID=A0A2Z6RAB3_9GLOM|nr:hypothetical protein RclHR1_03400015 [Rhizophagus clarus]